MSRYLWPLIALVVGVSGCVTMKTVKLQDGRPGYSLDHCSDAVKCMNLAAKRCGGPYRIIESHGGQMIFACGEAAP